MNRRDEITPLTGRVVGVTRMPFASALAAIRDLAFVSARYLPTALVATEANGQLIGDHV